MTDPIKAKIQELCPDVLELKFGCEVLFQRTPDLFLMSTIVAVKGKRVSYLIEGKFGVEVHNLPADKYILGSPITLAVVLWAIGKITPELSTIIMKRGNIYVPKKGIGAHLLWNLEHDNYDAQSQETKDFIGSLLNV